MLGESSSICLNLSGSCQWLTLHTHYTANVKHCHAPLWAYFRREHGSDNLVTVTSLLMQHAPISTIKDHSASLINVGRVDMIKVTG